MPNSLYDDEEDLHEQTGPEISVGTTSIVGIFFVLVLICAVFFGIGYTLGRRQGIAQGQAATAQPQTAAVTPPPTTPAPAKPSPGSLVDTASTPDTPGSDEPATVAPAPSKPAPAAPALIPAKATVPARPAPAPAPVAAAPATSTPGAVLVQIAALTHEDDAQNEVSELRKRGFNVFARHDPNDRFIRIQIGPFATRKEAKDMCDRLLASGYNAIIK